MDKKQMNALVFSALIGVAAAWTPSANASDNDGGTAPAASGGSGGLEEIVVTAQRKEQSLQSIPISVDVVNGSDFESLNLQSAADIGAVVSSVHIRAESQFLIPNLRDIGSNQTTAGNEPVVATYIDGVYVARLAPGLLQLDSVERVEVVEGPQGTLFGRNSAAGLIQIVTSEPTPGSNLSVKASVGYGNYETVQSKLYASTGISDTIAADFGFVSNDQNAGWGTNYYNGSQFGSGNSFALRTKWVFLPTDATKVVFTSSYTYDSGTIGAETLYHSGHARPDGSSGYFNDSGLPPLLGFYDSDTDQPFYHTTKSWDASIRIEQDVSFARLIDITATRDTKDEAAGDYDETPLFGTVYIVPDYDRQVTEEIQLQSKIDSPLDWTAGVFYFNHRYGYYPSSYLAGNNIFGTPTLALGVPAYGRTNSYAGYGQATYPIISNLRVTLGARYTDDQLIAGGTENLETYPALTVIKPGVPASANSSNTNTSFKAGLDYTVYPDVMLYGSASRGYKSELYNIITFNPKVIKPERLDDFEVGVKSEFLSHRIRLNADAFRYNIGNYQAQVIGSGAENTIQLTTAGGARVNGAELTVAAAATDALTLRLGATYADAYYTSFAGAPFYSVNRNPPYGLLAAVYGNAAGKALTDAPKFSGNTGFEYRVPVATSALSFVGNYSYQSAHFWDPDNLVQAPAVGLLDASITLHARNGLDIGLWGTNLTGKKYYSAEIEGSGSVGVIAAPAAPRLYGLRVGFKM